MLWVPKIHISLRLLTKTKVKTDRKEIFTILGSYFWLSGPLMEPENFISILVHLSGAPITNRLVQHFILLRQNQYSGKEMHHF